MKDLFLETEINMKHAVDHLHEELKHLRTGRASLTVLDGVVADYYGTPTPLNQLAGLSVPDPSTILVQPYDPSAIEAIEKAVLQSNLGLTPSNDGKLIRLPVPTLTEEIRRDLVKKAHEFAEGARNAVRHARREGNDKLKEMEREKDISQDDEHRGMDEHQKLHDHYIGEIANALKHKEDDIMTI
jgi:ribosome recycling factor